MKVSNDVHDGPARRWPVIALVDHDDPDVVHLERALTEAGLELISLPLGLAGGEYQLEASLDWASLQQGDGVVVGSREISRAPVVFHRRWRLSPPVPAISLDLHGDPGRFGEGEWEAAIEFALAMWAESSPGGWANPPDVEQNRLSLYRLARECGLSVPETAVATQHRDLPSSAVSKAVASNECIFGETYFPTTLLAPTVLEELMSQRSPCPNLVQAAIAAERELRLVYSFGEIAVLALSRPDDDRGPVDIRYVDRLQREVWELPAGVGEYLLAFASSARLQLFTADILIDRNGTYWVVDITPNGVISVLDDDNKTLLQCFIDGFMKAIYASPHTLQA